jgi:hypothetical protein
MSMGLLTKEGGGVSAANIDRRRVAVDAGLEWAWAAMQQVERLRRDEQDLLISDDAELAERRHRSLALRADAELCAVATSNLVLVASWLGRPGDRDAAADHAIDRLTRSFTPVRRRRGARGHLAVIDLRDEPQRCSYGAAGTRIGDLSLDELEDLLRVLLDYFTELEASAFMWDGWRRPRNHAT